MYELSITNVDISYQRMNTAPLQTHCQPHSKYVQPLLCIQIWLYRKNKSVEHNWRTASRTGTPSAAETSNDVPSALDRNLTGCRLHKHCAVFQDSTLIRWMTGSRRFKGPPKYAASHADTEPCYCRCVHPFSKPQSHSNSQSCAGTVVCSKPRLHALQLGHTTAPVALCRPHNSNGSNTGCSTHR